MNPISISQFEATQAQLLALMRADIPLSLGNSPRAIEQVAKIGQGIVRRMRDGVDVWEVLKDPEIPAPYRSVMQMALANDDPSSAFTTAVRTGRARADCAQNLLNALKYPFFLCCLAYCGLVFVTLGVIPHVRSSYESFELPRSSGLAALELIASTFPVWGSLVPLLLLAAWAWASLSGWKGMQADGWTWWSWLLPGTSRIDRDIRSAVFAESLAEMLKCGRTLPEALRASRVAWSDPRHIGQIEALAAAVQHGEVEQELRGGNLRLPSYLLWTIQHGGQAIGNEASLRLAADAYLEAARQRIDRIRWLAPIVTCIGIGGVITLLFGLTLFVPMSQMLQELAQ